MFELEPIGYVISELKERGKRGYVRACIEINERHAKGLEGLERCSHILVVAFLDRSKRILTVDLPFHNGGVFAVRSPDRPNPIGITTSRIERIDGRRIYLEKLDFLDGTPIIDIKPYTMSDCILGYENSIENKMIVSRNDGINALLSLASGFHGELCTGIATGVRIVYEALKIKGTMRFDSISSPYGCEIDAFQSLCSCTTGNGKLKLWNRDYFLISDIEIKLKREPASLDDALYGDILSIGP
jgi:formylmethanofuran dehydrogenase subunit E